MTRIIVVSGGSGGHIFPAYALLEELQKSFSFMKIVFIISGRPEEKRILNYIKNKLPNLKILVISIMPFKKNFLNLFTFIFNFIKGSIYSFLFTLFFHPNAVIGFGGILSIPLIISAFFLKIPTIIHEQNIFPGKANRFLSHFVKKVAISFEESKDYFDNEKKLLITGNPLRPDLSILEKSEALKKIGLNPHSFTLLVLGGSQGASSINCFILDIYKEMKKRKLELQLIHITGLRDFCWMLSEYGKVDPSVKIFPFYEDMGLLYSASDLVIGRAGASTLNELSYFAKPAIVIPYPYAQKHQFLNALHYFKKAAILLVEEKRLNQKETYDLIYDIIKNKEKQKLLSQNIKKINNPFSAKLLADAVVKLCKDRYA